MSIGVFRPGLRVHLGSSAGRRFPDWSRADVVPPVPTDPQRHISNRTAGQIRNAFTETAKFVPAIRCKSATDFRSGHQNPFVPWLAIRV